MCGVGPKGHTKTSRNLVFCPKIIILAHFGTTNRVQRDANGPGTRRIATRMLGFKHVPQMALTSVSKNSDLDSKVDVKFRR